MQWITYLCNQTGRRSVQHRANAGENLSRMMLTIMTIISDPVLQLQQGRPPVLLLQALNSLSLRSCSVRTLGGGRHVSHLLCWVKRRSFLSSSSCLLTKCLTVSCCSFTTEVDFFREAKVWRGVNYQKQTTWRRGPSDVRRRSIKFSEQTPQSASSH